MSFFCLCILIGPLGAESGKILPDAGEFRVACVGDSITYGFGILDRKNKNYPGQLSAALPKGWIVRNFGVNGACAGAGSSDYYGNTGMPTQVRAWQPDLLLFMLGTNDTKKKNWVSRDRFIRDYTGLLQDLKAGASQVVLMIPPPSGMNFVGIRDSVLTGEIIPAIYRIADEKGYEVVDFYHLMSGSPDSFFDNVHPTSEGYSQMAEYLSKRLNRGK